MKEEIVKELMKWMMESKEFVIGQAPDYIQQLLTYKTTVCYLLIGMFVFFILLGITLILLSLKYIKVNGMEVCFVIGVFMLLVSFVLVVSPINNIIKIKKAPKVFVMEHLTELIKK